MKYRHYAPKGELSIVSGESKAVISYINEQICKKQKEGFKVGVIGTSETIAEYSPCIHKNIGSRNNEAEIARNLYEILREFDAEEADYMYTEAFSTSGMGQAIMNRLLKAAGHRVIEVK
jgi:L-threonylcarbamoyladenylate synthase